MKKGFIVLEDQTTFEGEWLGGKDSCGEVVFNTSHSGYEEIATDPSYFNQIMVMTAPMQGNYGSRSEDKESENYWIKGFVALEIQNSNKNQSWLNRLTDLGIPVLQSIDTRKLTLHLRDRGTVLGAAVQCQTKEMAIQKMNSLLSQFDQDNLDWPFIVSTKSSYEINGTRTSGPRVAVLDYGIKSNILREIISRSSEVKVFNSRTPSKEVFDWKPDRVLLSNGPGNPEDVKEAPGIIKEILGKVPVMGICMGHQLMSLALGGKTFKLKFGHRGGNHPVKDTLLDQIYMTSQNHGYAVDSESLPKDIKITQTNLYDGTAEGIYSEKLRCLGIQYHPESHPGPHEGSKLFDFFIEKL